MPEGKKIDASGGCDLVTPEGVTPLSAHEMRGGAASGGRGGFFVHEVREGRFSPFFFARQRKSRWR